MDEPISAVPASPSRPEAPPLTIVGIGASAGGLAALEALLASWPSSAAPPAALVVLQHMQADREPMLAGLLVRHTWMEVVDLRAAIRPEAGHVYVNGPGHDVVLADGRLEILESLAIRGLHLPVDRLFGSLADELGADAIGVVLSGTGSDGTAGIRKIKAAGGVAVAQTPGTAQFDGMPRSALQTGLVDIEAPPEEIPTRVLEYVRRLRALDSATPLSATALDRGGPIANALTRILVALRAETGHDFTHYKRSTVARRLERRMAVCQTSTLEEYATYLEQTPREAHALIHSLLIGVTSFFRDPGAFAVLESSVVPALFDQGPRDRPVRVWCVGCSTGEEAYSLAMLLQEHKDRVRSDRGIQIFATDIDAEAIATARVGLYPASIAKDVSPERLTLHFTVRPGAEAFEIRKHLRDTVIFSEQDVLRDPPFSRMDLVSCRNVLIYMDAVLQRRLIPVFHYALRPGGFLFLGSSESVTEYTEAFDTVDRSEKVFRATREPYATLRDSSGGPVSSRWTRPVVAAPPRMPAARRDEAPSLREVAERAILTHVVPMAVLTDRRGEVLYVHGRTGAYLEPAPGEGGAANLFKMARGGLEEPLFSTLHRAVRSRRAERAAGVVVESNGGTQRVDLAVEPLPLEPEASPDARLYLVVFSPSPVETSDDDAAISPSVKQGEAEDQGPSSARVAELERTLRSKDEYLRRSSEELEQANQELRSANEEMQSMNEELQSTNEELETSKEEMQSINEELATVNGELEVKVNELTRANDDMNNLLAGTDIGTIFVDHALRIMRFTPSATRQMNLISSDVGRPVGHISSKLVGYEGLLSDTQRVLDTLVPVVREVQTDSGAWHSMRIQPYRTTGNQIQGAVITFVDVSSYRELARRQRRAAEVSRAVLDARAEALAVLDENLCLVQASTAFLGHVGVNEEAVLERPLASLGSGPWRAPAVLEWLAGMRESDGNPVGPVGVFPAAGERYPSAGRIHARRIDVGPDGDRRPYLLVGIEPDARGVEPPEGSP